MNPKAPEGEGKKWDPHRGFTFWHFLDGVPEPEKMISVFIALTDQTEGNGAVRTWGGSHLISLKELKEETDFNGRKGINRDTAEELSLQIKPGHLQSYQTQLPEVHLTGKAGTVWLIHALNLHASAPNLSSGVRELVANVFRSSNNQPAHPRAATYLCEPG